MKQTIWIILAGLFLASPALAQRGWEAGAWAGVSYYFGDLNTNYNLSKPNLAGGLAARFNFNKRIAVRFTGNYGMVEADDADSRNAFERARNLSFRSQIFDVSTGIEFNFLPYTHGSKDEFFTPYVFAGLSVFSFNPEAELDGEYYELRPLGTEGQFQGEEYYTVQAGMNYGIGVKVDLNYEWSLNFELSARHLFTDYLDDVSTVYPDLSDLERQRGEIAVMLSDRSIQLPDVDNSQLGLPGTQRGNSANNDSYVFLKAGIMYYFGQLRCPIPN